MYTSHNYYFTYYKKNMLILFFKELVETKTKTLKKHNKAIKTEIIDILLNGRNSKEYKMNKQIKKHDDDEKNNRLVSYNVLVAAVNMQNKTNSMCNVHSIPFQLAITRDHFF